MNNNKSLEFLPSGWKAQISGEFQRDHMCRLREFLRSEYRSGYTVFPAKSDIFKALTCVDYDDVNVVILGQDPYHNPGQANGLAFAVPTHVPAPPSLQNIFKELRSDFKHTGPLDPSLEHWTQQGVLLLNTVLTVRAHRPLSHRNQGWEQFTDSIIKTLNQRKKPLVFLLWGSSAQSKATLITQPQHAVFKAPHPSPLSAHRGFLGCQHFSKTNEYLKTWGRQPICWIKQPV